MNKISCNIIKDLLPLYVDEVVSEDSRVLVEEHFASCPYCREEAEKMKKVLLVPVDEVMEEAEVSALKRFQKMLRTRRFWTMAVTATVVVALMFGIHCLLHIPQIFIPYEEGLVQVQKLEDGTLRLQYCGETYRGFVGGGNILIKNEDGSESFATLIYYYHSPWTKYIEPLYTFDEQAVLHENRGKFDLTPIDGIPYTKVYYASESFSGPFRAKKHRMLLNPEYPEKNLETAILIYDENLE